MKNAAFPIGVGGISRILIAHCPLPGHQGSYGLLRYLVCAVRAVGYSPVADQAAALREYRLIKPIVPRAANAKAAELSSGTVMTSESSVVTKSVTLTVATVTSSEPRTTSAWMDTVPFPTALKVRVATD